VERTKVLVHLIDAYQDDVAAAYKTIQNELAQYKNDLTKHPQIVVLNKIDGLDEEIIGAQLAALKPVVPKGTPLLTISAASKQGLKELLYEVKSQVNAVYEAEAAEEPDEDEGVPLYTIQPEQLPWKVIKQGDIFLVK